MEHFRDPNLYMARPPVDIVIPVKRVDHPRVETLAGDGKTPALEEHDGPVDAALPGLLHTLSVMGEVAEVGGKGLEERHRFPYFWYRRM
jgi:hypothetical protein